MLKLFIAISVLLCGGLLFTAVAQRTWHQKYDWIAEEYFDDPRVISLCKAIEANDIQEIDRLVAAGANVNAKGEGNMTPLMWAWPDNKLARFQRLLEHGADPNVIVTSDLGTGNKTTLPGVAITHLATKSNLPEHFSAVFNHGGDPNLPQKSRVARGDTPLCFLIQGGFPDKKQRIQLLIDKGVDLNRLVGGRTLPMRAVGWGGQYDIALMLLKTGANPKAYSSNEWIKLAHVLVGEEQADRSSDPFHKQDFQRLVSWIEDHGESMEEARKDIKRWSSWSKSRKNGGKSEFRIKMNAEIAARKAREAREKKAKEKQVQAASVPESKN